MTIDKEVGVDAHKGFAKTKSLRLPTAEKLHAISKGGKTGEILELVRNSTIRLIFDAEFKNQLQFLEIG